MALGTQSASIGGASKSLIVALDPSGNLAAAHVNVNSGGAEVGVSANPFAVAVGNFPATQPVSISTLPALASGANTIGAVTQASGPWTVSWSGQSVAAAQSGTWTVGLSSGSTVTLGAGSAAIGSIAVTNFPPTQNVSAASWPLPAGAAQDGSDATGVTPPTGGIGIRGWLSGIYARLTGTLSVAIATALPTGSNVIGAVTGSGTFTVAGQGTTGATPVGPPMSISGIDAAGLKQHIRTDTFGTPADSAWTSGAGSLVALGKAIVAAQQATTAAVTGSSLVPPSPSFVQSAALASNLVLKVGPGSLYGCYVTTGSTPGWMMLFDATAVPPNGPVAPKDCIYCPPNATTDMELPFLTAEPFATGISVAFSSTGPFTLTASASAFIKGIVQ